MQNWRRFFWGYAVVVGPKIARHAAGRRLTTYPAAPANQTAVNISPNYPQDNKLASARRFALIMSQVGRKCLTYAQLTSKGTDTECTSEGGPGKGEPF